MNYFIKMEAALSVLILLNISTAMGFTVHNAGVNGNNTRNALSRFDTDVAAVKPQFCFMAFGMNDAMGDSNPVPLDEYRKNLLTLAEKCRAAGIQPVFITVNPVNKEKLYERHKAEFYEQQGGPNAMIEQYNLIIKEVAAQSGSGVIDWHKKVMELSGSSVDPGAVLRTDGVHLSPDGLNALGGLVADWLRNSGKPDATIVAFGDSITKQGWIDIAVARCSGVPGTRYTSSVAPTAGHGDSNPPFRLLDGQYKSVVSHSVEYPGDPVIEFILPTKRFVKTVDVRCFSRTGYLLDDVAVEVTADGKTWETAGKKWSQIPVQGTLKDEACSLPFSVNREISGVRVMPVRQAGQKRVLISEVKID